MYVIIIRIRRNKVVIEFIMIKGLMPKEATLLLYLVLSPKLVWVGVDDIIS